MEKRKIKRESLNLTSLPKNAWVEIVEERVYLFSDNWEENIDWIADFDSDNIHLQFGGKTEGGYYFYDRSYILNYLIQEYDLLKHIPEAADLVPEDLVIEDESICVDDPFNRLGLTEYLKPGLYVLYPNYF